MKTKHYDSRVDDVIAKAASGAHVAVDRAAQASQHANHSLHKTARQLRSKEQQWVDASGDYVHRHPLLVVGCAVAAGFLLSKLLQRRPAPDHFPED